MKSLSRILGILFFSFLALSSSAQSKHLPLVPDAADREVKIFTFKIMQMINPTAWRITMKSIQEAKEKDAELIILHMNTYGGLVDMADSIRTAILNSPIPVIVYIDNNAASAGALIAIAADKIYMRKGASIGAATVVDQSGQPVPDKYQSFMRSTMRATAEAHGKDTIVQGNDTILKWKRDPKIAEAMVDPSTYIPGVIDTGKVLTFTTEEAIQFGYCEGTAENIEEILKKEGISNYTIEEYKPTRMDKLVGFMKNPVFQSILIMIIIAGIYFELQTPGIGFPLAAAVMAAVLYFSPLYIEGIAQNWEILIFIVGLILIGVEIFAIPGFGIAGISGIALVITGLALSMVDNIVFELDGLDALTPVTRAFFIVIASMILSLFLSIYLSSRLLRTGFLSRLALKTSQDKNDGYIGVDAHMAKLVGKSGKALTGLRPSGKVEIDGELYDACSEIGFIEAGTEIEVIRFEAGQVNVVKRQI